MQEAWKVNLGHECEVSRMMAEDFGMIHNCIIKP